MFIRSALLLLVQLGLALAVQPLITSSFPDDFGRPLKIAFAPHPFLSHWAVSTPIARELLQRGHKALVSTLVVVGFGAWPV